MKKSLVLFAAVLSLGAVAAHADDDITGILSVRQTFQITDKDHKARVLQSGASYRLNVDPDGNPGRQVLKLNLKDFEGHDRQAKLQLGQAPFINSSNGPFNVTGNLVGQQFDMQGAYNTQYSQSAQYDHASACSLTRNYECNCRFIDRWDAWSRRYVHDRVCESCTQTYFGTRHDLVHDETSTTTLNAAFLSPGTGNQLATFSGSSSRTTMITDVAGAFCQ